MRATILHVTILDSCHHFAERRKEKSRSRRLISKEFLGWLMGLEPTTTGITIRDSTN